LIPVSDPAGVLVERLSGDPELSERGIRMITTCDFEEMILWLGRDGYCLITLRN
jgi:hypothetical protein